MLGDLFERIGSTSTAPRDPQAEAFISDSIRAKPYAPYVLSQTVLVQQQALEAAQKHIDELEEQLKSASQPQQSSFLGKLFGGGSSPAPAPRPSSYDASAYQRSAPGPSYAPPPQQGYAPQQQGYAPQPGPWGAPAGGSSFLGSALQTASGVAGGVLLANAVEGLFSGSHGGGGLFGGSGAGFMGGGGFGGPREEVVNNYYETGTDPAGQRAEDTLQDMDQDQDDAQDAQDAGGGWDDSSSDA